MNSRHRTISPHRRDSRKNEGSNNPNAATLLRALPTIDETYKLSSTILKHSDAVEPVTNI
jgi:hypothetical protein